MEISPFRYILPNLGKIGQVDSFFNLLKENYPVKRKNSYFENATHEGILIYCIHTADRKYFGILAGVNIEEYLKGNIKKHENTLITQEENMIALTLERNAIIKPVLITYPEDPDLSGLIAEIVEGNQLILKVEFGKSGQIHEFYQPLHTDQQTRIIKLFKKRVKSAYIADGHHRMAAMNHILEARPQLIQKGLGQIMCAWFGFSELSILPYNRVIQLQKALSSKFFTEILPKYGKLKLVENPAPPEKKHEIILVYQNNFFRLKWNKKIIDSYKSKNGIAFDIDLFNELFLHQHFGISDVRRDPCIKYIEGVKGLKGITKEINLHEHAIGFWFYPVSYKDFKKTADQGKILPPKSTWFEPRIRNGLVVQEFSSNKQKS